MKAMRYTARALVAAIVIVACSSSDVFAAETSSRWWPFGKKDDANVAATPKATPPSTSPLPLNSPNMAAARPGVAAKSPIAQGAAPSAGTAAEPATKEHWMLSSPTGKVSWPHLNTPKSGMFAEKPAADATKNSWVDKPVTPKASPLKPITDGAHKFTDGTKSAWHKTVAAVKGESTPAAGSNTGSRIAKREVQPPFWKR